MLFLGYDYSFFFCAMEQKYKTSDRDSKVLNSAMLLIPLSAVAAVVVSRVADSLLVVFAARRVYSGFYFLCASIYKKDR